MLQLQSTILMLLMKMLLLLRTSGHNLLMADDSDADDDDSFTVTQIAVTGSSIIAVSSGTTNSNGTSVTGTYGTLSWS